MQERPASPQILLFPQPHNHAFGCHKECPACEEIRATLICSISAESKFSEAAKAYLQMRSLDLVAGAATARYIRKNTEISYTQYAETLELFFGETPLGEIQWHNLRAYQAARVAGADPFVRYRRPQDAKPRKVNGMVLPPKGKTPCPAKPKKVNQELGFLKHLMQLAGAWGPEFAKFYSPLLDEDEEIPRALNAAEQRTWLEVARSAQRWDLVYWYSIFAFGTCMSTDEIRGLRLADVNLYQRIVSVPRKSAKNRHRSRTIEIVGADVLWAIERILEKAAERGARAPMHYLFPSRATRGKWEPVQPMSESGLKRPWEEVRAASGLTWFRPYDTRHTAITRLAEAGVPIDVIMSRAGHVSEKMRRHYTHVSQSAQRKWLEHANNFHYAPPAIAQDSPWARKPAVGEYEAQVYGNGHVVTRRH